MTVLSSRAGTSDERRAEEVLAADARGARLAARRERTLVYGGIVLTGAFLLLFWEYGIGLVVDQRYVSRPSAVAARLADLLTEGALWPHVSATMTEAGLGYLLGVGVGLAVAIVLVSSPLLEEVTAPFVAGFYSIPKIALGPLFIMWFGLGALPKVLLAALMVFLIVLINTVAGVRSISPGLVDSARVMGAGGLTLVRTVVLPGAAPAVVASIRLTFSRAMVGAILGEFIAAQQGLGFLIVRASRQFDTATVYAGVLVVAALVMAVGGVLRLVEARLMPWSGTVEVRG
ncbi:ABC transporter permease [Actinomadura sp. NBRC 104412]|uniref:ABC transporter permease n=1 Tax=Actinomadura sp. NBRC 104412 TaxID=3032203 RepID=UPI0024A40B8D|nr:ABC transporter permease [Actinomadura sp. NBRC 104412]GLZ08279.1 ABC transporter permease [Actinomadura sp. NBRC 104412]